MVVPGSLKREGVNVEFTVTDKAKSMRVTYRGQLPDLFREGKGVVAQGQLGADGNVSAPAKSSPSTTRTTCARGADAVKRAQQTVQRK